MTTLVRSAPRNRIGDPSWRPSVARSTLDSGTRPVCSATVIHLVQSDQPRDPPARLPASTIPGRKPSSTTAPLNLNKIQLPTCQTVYIFISAKACTARSLVVVVYNTVSWTFRHQVVKQITPPATIISNQSDCLSVCVRSNHITFVPVCFYAANPGAPPKKNSKILPLIYSVRG